MKTELQQAMYGLFMCTYDGYGWKDLICVSGNIETLKSYYDEIGTCRPLVVALNGDVNSLEQAERDHYAIEEIEVV